MERLLFFVIISLLLIQLDAAPHPPPTVTSSPTYPSFSSASRNLSFTKIPTFCVDPNVLRIFGRRLGTSCINSGSMLEEHTLYLRKEKANEYQRSHELLAYHWFVEEKNNPYRRPCSEADFEYIPLLPLHWKAISTSASIAGSSCSYTALIEDIVAYQAYLKEDVGVALLRGVLPRFAVASTYNLRTEMVVLNYYHYLLNCFPSQLTFFESLFKGIWHAVSNPQRGNLRNRHVVCHVVVSRSL